MKLIVKNKDLKEVVAKITWSGDSKSVARKLAFDIAYSASDYYFKMLDIKLSEGNIVILKSNDDEVLFRGVIIDIKLSKTKSTISYLAYDFNFYVNNSEINKVYDDSPENIAVDVASTLGIPTGEIAATGEKVYLVALPEKAYKVIMMAYTYASRKNGKKYMPIMNDDKLCVIEKGLDSGVVIDGDRNLVDVNYQISLSKMVSKVLLTNKTGDVTKTIKSDEFIKKYGIVQKVIKEDEAKANSLIHGADRSISIVALGDLRAVSGKSLVFKDPDNNLLAKFYIDSDSHSFENGKHLMNLNLNFENIMDEAELKERK